MKERPILFSGPMVRALLAGTKTQTRRVVKPQPQPNGGVGLQPLEPYCTSRGDWNWVLAATGHGTGDPFPCPYGQPGDRLWVRETWAYGIHALAAKRDENGPFVYAADGTTQGRLCDRWRPSIHMPRWASRITLELTGVRVERLQDMEGQAPYPGDSDALAEGVNRIDHGRGDYHFSAFRAEPHPKNWNDPADAFRELWESINGPDSWAANPWVWVVELKPVATTR